MQATRDLLLTGRAIADLIESEGMGAAVDVALTGAPGAGTRFAMTDQLMNRLSDRRRLVVIGEAQNLN